MDRDPTGLVMLALFGAIIFAGHPHPVAAVVALVLVVVVHELGHAGAALALGATATVGCNALGGHTITPEVGLLSRPRRALLAVAGPGLGLLVALLAWWALPATSPGTGTWQLVWWSAVFGVVLNAYNLLPLPAADGAHLLELAVNDRGRPRRRWAVSAVQVATILAVVTVLWRLGLPLLGVVIGALAALRLRGRLSGPDPRVATVQAAGLRGDADALLELARASGAPDDLLGTVLARQARRDAAVIRALQGRGEEAEQLLLGTPDPDGTDACLLALVRDGPRGVATLARWVAERAGRTLPPALAAAPDAETRLLRTVLDTAPALSLGDHQTLLLLLLQAERWPDARVVADQLWQRGRGPDTAIHAAVAAGGAGDDRAARAWLLAARDAGGDVRPYLAHAAELAGVRDRADMRALLAEGPHPPVAVRPGATRAPEAAPPA